MKGEELEVSVYGFTDGLYGKNFFGPTTTADLVAVFPDGELTQHMSINMANEQGEGLFIFSRAEMPTALVLHPGDGSDPVTLWEAGDPIPEAAGEPAETNQ